MNSEINVQLGELTLKKHRVHPLHRRYLSHSEFKAVFGDAGHTNGFVSAEVSVCRLSLDKIVAGT